MPHMLGMFFGVRQRSSMRSRPCRVFAHARSRFALAIMLPAALMTGPRPDAVADAAPEPIVFSTEFDSGGGVSVASRTETHFDLTLEDAQGYRPKGYLHFKLSGVKGRTVSFAFTNLNDSRMPSGFRLLYSETPLESLDYRRMDETVGDGFAQRFDADTVFIANYYPYPYAHTVRQVLRHREHPFATVRAIGESHEGRAMYALVLSDPAVDESQKRDVVFLTRQHPGETVGSYHMDGMIDYVLDVFEAADRAFDGDFRFHFLPHANPDGIYNGYHRFCAQGFDLNRRWASDSPVEIQNLKQYLLAHAPAAWRGIDLHATTNRGYDALIYYDDGIEAHQRVAENVYEHIRSLRGLRARPSSGSRFSRSFFHEALGGFMITTEKWLYAQTFDPDSLRAQGRHFLRDLIAPNG